MKKLTVLFALAGLPLGCRSAHQGAPTPELGAYQRTGSAMSNVDNVVIPQNPQY
jgi:hypothetical protein